MWTLILLLLVGQPNADPKEIVWEKDGYESLADCVNNDMTPFASYVFRHPNSPWTLTSDDNHIIEFHHKTEDLILRIACARLDAEERTAQE